jgi:hypothetical protein
MVGFDNGDEQVRADGLSVATINPDLTATSDVTQAKTLEENLRLSFIGTQRGGAFDITAEAAQRLISADPSNRDVVRPWSNADDVTSRSRNMWIINFRDLPLIEAEKYEAPLRYVIENVKHLVMRIAQAQPRVLWQFQRQTSDVPGLLLSIQPRLKGYNGASREAEDAGENGS